MIKVAYSVLSSNFLNLKQDIKVMGRADVDLLHLDIMDGYFVENITFGAQMVKNISEFTSLPLDCHLMVEEPSSIIDQLLELDVDMISFHVESKCEIIKNINKIRNQGVKVGLALNPDTSVDLIEEYLPSIDFVLQMTVNPGYGGQLFIDSALKNIERLRKIKKQKNLNFRIEVDGGINSNSAKKCIAAGADILVSGSYLKNSIYTKGSVDELKK